MNKKIFKVRCVTSSADNMLVVGKIYTVVESRGTRYLLNVFENQNDYAPMYGSFESSHFEIT